MRTLRDAFYAELHREKTSARDEGRQFDIGDAMAAYDRVQRRPSLIPSAVEDAIRLNDQEVVVVEVSNGEQRVMAQVRCSHSGGVEDALRLAAAAVISRRSEEIEAERWSPVPPRQEP